MLDERLELLRPLLERYRRRFTVLDLGSNDGSIAGWIAREFDAVVTCVERNYPNQVTENPEGLPVMVLKKEFSGDDLALLAECEHFDVVLALNFLHHFSVGDWKQVARSTLKLGDHIFIQLPKPEDSGAPGQEFTVDMLEFLHDALTLGETVQFPGHMPRPLRLHYRAGPTQLTRSSVTSPDQSGMWKVHSSFKGIYGTSETKRREWIPGINLWNFLQLGGAWPLRSKVLDLLKAFPLPESNHGDMVPHNFIFDGQAIYLIDGYEGWEFDDQAVMAKTIAIVESMDVDP